MPARTMASRTTAYSSRRAMRSDFAVARLALLVALAPCVGRRNGRVASIRDRPDVWGWVVGLTGFSAGTAS